MIDKDIKHIQNSIDPNTWYTPKQVADFGLIVNTLGRPEKWFVYRLIKSGKLPFRNVCLVEGKNYFQIKGEDIIKYNNEAQLTQTIA